MSSRGIFPKLAVASFVLVISCVLTLISFWQKEPAAAQGDITAPVIVDINFEPNQIDTSNGSATITVTVRVTDDLSGVAHVVLAFRKPETTQTAQVEFRSDQGWSELIEGDELDGVHLATMTLPQYAAEGWWEMYVVAVEDKVGNRADFWSDSDEWPFQESYGFWIGKEIIPTPTPERSETPTATPDLTATQAALATEIAVAVEATLTAQAAIQTETPTATETPTLPPTYTTYLSSILNPVVATPVPTIPIRLQSSGANVLDNYLIKIDEEQERIWFLGEVQNDTGEEVQRTRITYSFYNAADELISSGDLLTARYLLPAGSKTCFQFGTHSQVIDASAYLTITTDFWPSGGSFSSLTILDHSAVYNEEAQSYDITGRIRNDGDDEKTYLRIIGTLYDHNGRVMQCESRYLDVFVLPPGVTGLWSLSFPDVDPSQIGGYRVEGD